MENYRLSKYNIFNRKKEKMTCMQLGFGKMAGVARMTPCAEQRHFALVQAFVNPATSPSPCSLALSFVSEH